MSLLISTSCYCQIVDTITAKRVAANYFLSKLSKEETRKAGKAIGLKLVHQVNMGEDLDQLKGEAPIPLYYVFNVNDNSGFIIVSAENKTKPILAYSLTDTYDKYNQPQGMIYWLNYLKKQIEHAKTKPIKVDKTILNEWDKYISGSTLKVETPVEPLVGPLLSEIKWGQRNCYEGITCDVYCNTDGETYIKDAAVGCVATAMGQLMMYYRYPLIGESNHSYIEPPNEAKYNDDGYLICPEFPSLGTLEANFEATTYDWENMPMTYNNSLPATSTQYLAISKLLFHCGIGVEMDYACSSLANVCGDATNALKNYFRYSSLTECKRKSNFENELEWVELLKMEINNKRPIIYRGDNGGIGHAFICDGYDSNNNFHFNWGWEGSYNDTWYAISLIDPGSYDFSNNQFAIIGITPELEKTTQDKYEYDNTFYYAKWISNNKMQIRSISPADDIDWVKFELKNKSSVVIETEGIIGDTELWLYESDGNTLIKHNDNKDSNNFSRIDIDFLQVGTYYIKVAEKGSDVCIPSYKIILNATSLGEDSSPNLLNPRVTPLSGTENDTYRFRVDYHDKDGDPPKAGYKSLFINDRVPASEYQMELESGTEADGIYYFDHTIPPGSYQYFFSFINEIGQSAKTNWKEGPDVFSLENIVINPVVKCLEFSKDLFFGFRIGEVGSYTMFEITGESQLDPITVPAGSRVYFTAYTDNPNYAFDFMRLTKGDQLIGDWQSSFYIDFGTNDYGAHTLEASYTYTPQEYTISGTVLDDGGQIIGEEVELNLTSSQNNKTVYSTDGTFQFNDVKGGVSVSVAANANGYSFSPANLTYNNLKDNYSDLSFTGYSNDVSAPTTTIITNPDPICTQAAVTFEWEGSDDLSTPQNLQFQYYLEGADNDWSSLSTSTMVNYSLPNGVYNFKVRAIDEAGNIDQSPTSYSFIVNANPQIIYFQRSNRGVWASRIRIEMPDIPENPSDRVVLLPYYSGINDDDLVPAKIYRAGENNPGGILDVISDHSLLDVWITKELNKYVFTLPETLSGGESVEFDIEWGKIKYFGWSEFTELAPGFSDGGTMHDAYLDNQMNLWKSGAWNKSRGINACDYDAALIMNLSNMDSVIEESTLQFFPGECLNESAGNYTQINTSKLLDNNTNKFLIWSDFRYEYDNYNNTNYRRIGIQTFNDDGKASSATYLGDYYTRANLALPEKVINNSAWIVGKQRDGSHISAQNSAFFFVVDDNGNLKIPQTEFDNIQSDYDSDIYLREAIPIGENVLLIWQRFWFTSDYNERIEINYQIRDYAGNLILPTTRLHEALIDDNIDKYDQYYVESILTDRDGKVWISFYRIQSGPIYNYYYTVIDSDGSILQNAIETAGLRTFSYCDKDGYIWASEGSQFFILDNQGSYIINPRSSVYSPNQDVGNIASIVTNSGYRLYDRWSPGILNIEIPFDTKIDKLEIYDLDIWNSNLHTLNPNLSLDGSTIWAHSGIFNNYSEIDISSSFKHGQNFININQDDILGGQLLLTFPLSPIVFPPPEISRQEVIVNDLRFDFINIPETATLNAYRSTNAIFTPDREFGSNLIATGINDQDPNLTGFQWTDSDATGDPLNNYFYIFTTVGGAESENSETVGEFDYSLMTTPTTNFNEIALPLNVQGVTTAANLMQMIPGCNSIARWNPETQGYEQYIDFIPETNFEVNPGYPYYVNVTADVVFTLTGEPASPSFNLITTPTTNFNEVMLTLDKTDISAASELLADIPYCNSIARWDPLIQGYEQYVSFIPETNFNVRTGYPYYVNVTSDVTWPTEAASTLKSASQSESIALIKTQSAPHLVYGTIDISESSYTYKDLDFNAYFSSTPEVSLTKLSAGCWIDNGHYVIQCNSLEKGWGTEEPLTVEIRDKFGLVLDMFDVQLTYNPADQGKDVILGEKGSYWLSQNVPNPFSDETEIEYHIAEDGLVILEIYSVTGQKVNTLVNEYQKAGTHRVTWDRTDHVNNRVKDGVYIYFLKTGGINIYKKAIIIR